MKTLITTLNAKYIHTALSLRLLYVASKDQHDVSYQEYTIKEDDEQIVLDILNQQPNIVAFSCYIWNIERIQVICEKLKKHNQDIIIILGGPEVTYEPEYFLDHFFIDYVMSGEGEITFPLLLSQIENGEVINVEGVSYQGHVSTEISQTPLSVIEQLDSPYILPQDTQSSRNRILYFETSRGCPFQCQYCLSSLEKGLRFYSKEYLKKQLDLIFASNVKTIKVLDRSFNANTQHALFVLQYIVEHHAPHQQFQFEINADVFPQVLLDYINEYAPIGLFRFEVGIQSTYEPTNRSVKRMQNFERLSEVIKQFMQGGKCDLHLDLIAGLPFETYERFEKSFDDVFAFRAKELQLGFLKLLRGTSLRSNADDYGYIYDENAPYEMIQNKWISPKEMHQIHLAEDMLEKYWNSGKFPQTMNLILDDEASAFDFFYRLGKYYEEHDFKFHQYQLFELFAYLDEFTDRNYHKALMIDYLSICKTKSKRWYEPTLTQKQRHQAIEYLSNEYQLNRDTLYRYAVIEKIENEYIIAIYQNMKCEMNQYMIKV